MYTTGAIHNFWSDLHTTLRYNRFDFNNQSDILKWRDQGFSQEYFTGELYDMRNQMPDWSSPFFNIFQGENIGICFYKMNTCNILPYHRDTYKKYIEIHKIKDTSKIKRAIIFLEDWKSGHIFEINNNPITKWRAGDYVLWKYDAPHMAANLGLEPRYTLQITFTDV